MNPPKTLLVAATGGHLEQLFRISARFEPESGPITWVTHRDAQSESLLQGSDVRFVPYVPPRGYGQIMRQVPDAWRLIRKGVFDRVVSTGAGVALPFFLAARANGVPCHYIESAARADGPSLTGRIVSRVPGVNLYSQYSGWATGRWNYRGSLFDAFDVREHDDVPIRKVVVTLGTMRTYEFTRLVDRLKHILPDVMEPDADVLWQMGVTTADPGFGTVAASVPNAQLREAIGQADLVVAHSGIGSAITALELGKRPVLVPRRPVHGEHVDEHQELIAGELGRRDLAVRCEADQITAEDLRRAARGRVVEASERGPFALVEG